MAGASRTAIAQHAITPAIYLALLILWEASVRFFHLPAWVLPAPSAIVLVSKDWAPELLFNSFVTLRETLVGFLLALVLSLPLAVVVAFTTTTRRIVYPILLGLQSVPKVALAPLVILWLGIGNWPKIVIVVLVCFFPILVNVVAGFEFGAEKHVGPDALTACTRIHNFPAFAHSNCHTAFVHRLQDRHHIRGDRRGDRRVCRGAGGFGLPHPDIDRAIPDAAGICGDHPSHE